MNAKTCFALGTWRLVVPRPVHALRVALIALVLVTMSMPWHAPRVARATGNFVVNSSADTVATDNFLTLREAILVANGTLLGPFSSAEAAQLGGCVFEDYYIIGGCGGFIFDNITFHPSVTQINLTNVLPELTDAGTWINGSAGVPRIDAGGMSPTGKVFTVSGNDITISNLSIVNGDPSGVADIWVASGKDARIAYNYLGTVPGATNCSPSGVTRNSAHGVYVAPNSSGGSGANNGVAYIYGNTIGCHSQDGIYVSGADYVYIGVQADGNTPDGNYIGTNSGEADLGNGGNGVFLQASYTDGVRSCVIKRNMIVRNHGDGIRLTGTGYSNDGSTSNNQIRSNLVFLNSQSGIRLTYGAYTNFVGGGDADDRNVIGLNSADGITILNSDDNLIQGNLIGTQSTVSYGNIQTGVYLGYANNNTLAGNTISANGWAGVWAYNSHYNTMRGNKIGTSDSGTVAMANGQDGIALTDGSHHNTIGGTTLADRNIISGNTHCGIHLRSGVWNNTIDSNLIGLNAAGTSAIPNGWAGVCVFGGSNNNTIGSSSSGVSQYISGNTREGIYIEDSEDTYIGQVNRIGVATDNTTARGNGLQGIMLNGANRTLAYPTLVAYNGGAGIAVIGATAYGNDIAPIEVRNNGGLPIDLGNDGHTPNDTDDADTGPNDLLNYPVITSASGNPVTLAGTACANCSVGIYRAVGNPAAPGGGGLIIQYANANGAGNWSAILPAGVGRNDVTLQTYQTSTKDASEMSPRPVVYLPLVLRNS